MGKSKKIAQVDRGTVFVLLRTSLFCPYKKEQKSWNAERDKRTQKEWNRAEKCASLMQQTSTCFSLFPSRCFAHLVLCILSSIRKARRDKS